MANNKHYFILPLSYEAGDEELNHLEATRLLIEQYPELDKFSSIIEWQKCLDLEDQKLEYEVVYDQCFIKQWYNKQWQLISQQVNLGDETLLLDTEDNIIDEDDLPEDEKDWWMFLHPVNEMNEY